MNFKQILLVLFLFLLPVSVMADDSIADDQLKIQDNCGLTDQGRINPLDMTVCNSDIAFSVLYESFQYFYDNYIFKVAPLKEFSVEDIEDENLGAKLRASNLMASMFKSILNVTFVFIFIVIIFNIILGIFKSLEDGSFMGKDFSFKSQIFYYLLASLLLIPIGDVLLIHLFIMLIALIAIVPANFIFTYFVYFLSILNSPMEVGEEPLMQDYGNNYYYAARAIDFHVNVDFCRRSTFNYIYTEGADRLDQDSDNYKECFLYNNNKFFTRETEMFSSDNPFLNYFSVNSGDLRYYKGNEYGTLDDLAYRDSRELFFYDELEYSKRIESPNCEEMRRGGEHFSIFACGMLSIQTPTEETHRVLLLDYELFLDSLIDLMSGLDINSFSSIDISQDFQIFRDKYINRANSILDNNNYSNRERNLARSLLHGSDKEVLEAQLIEAWHLAIYNHINFGTKIMKSRDVGGNEVLYENFNIVDRVREMAASLAKIKYEAHCLSDAYAMTNTYNFISRNNSNDKNAFCYNYENGAIFGDEGGNINFPIEGEGDLEILSSLAVESIQNFETEYDRLIDVLKNMYYQIELSIFSAYMDMDVRANSNMDVFTQARQNGFLSFPQMLLFVEKRVDEWENIRNRVFDSTKYVLSSTNQMNVSSNVYDESMDKNNNLFTVDDSFTQSYTTRMYGSEINSNDYIRDMTTYFVDTDEGLFDKISKTVIRTLIGNDIDRIMSTMGVRESFLNMEDTHLYTEYCSDPSTLGRCPIPQSNPLVSFNQLGVHFIEKGGKILAGVIGVNMASSYMSSKVSVAGNRSETAVGGGSSTIRSNTSTDRAFGAVASIMSMIAGIVGVFALFLIFIGAGFAFSIPLIPLIYMTVNFVQWIIHVFNLLFVSNIFVGYLFNISESRDNVIKFFKQNIMHILLLPSFVIISMLFLWSFYYVVIFFINLTLFTVLETSNNLFNGGSVASAILSMLNPIMMAFIMLYVLYAITKFVFSYISSMYQKIFNEIMEGGTDDGTSGAAKTILSFFAVTSSFNYLRGAVDNSNMNGVDKLRKKLERRNKVSSDLDRIISNNVKDFSIKNKDGSIREYDSPEDYALAINNEAVLTKDGKEIISRNSQLSKFLNDSIEYNKFKNIKGLDLDGMKYNGVDISNYNTIDDLGKIKEDNPDIFKSEKDHLDFLNMLNSDKEYMLLENIDGLNLKNMDYKGQSITINNLTNIMNQLKLDNRDIFELSNDFDRQAYSMWSEEKRMGYDDTISRLKENYKDAKLGLGNMYGEISSASAFMIDQLRRFQKNKAIKILDRSINDDVLSAENKRDLKGLVDNMDKISKSKTLNAQQNRKISEINEYIDRVMEQDNNISAGNHGSQINKEVKVYMSQIKDSIKKTYSKNTAYREYQNQYLMTLSRRRDIDILRGEREKMIFAGIDTLYIDELIEKLKEK